MKCMENPLDNSNSFLEKSQMVFLKESLVNSQKEFQEDSLEKYLDKSLLKFKGVR